MVVLGLSSVAKVAVSATTNTTKHQQQQQHQQETSNASQEFMRTIAQNGNTLRLVSQFTGAFCFAGLNIHYAAAFGQLERVKTLIRRNPNCVDETREGGWTPLHYACFFGHLNVVQYLVVESGHNIQVGNNHGVTPLHFACGFGHDDIVEYLIEKNPKSAMRVRDQWGSTPLHHAAGFGHLSTVMYLIQQDPMCLAMKNRNGQRPIHCAAQNGHLDVVQYIVQLNLQVCENRKRSHQGCSSSATSSSTPHHHHRRHCPPFVIQQRAINVNETNNNNNNNDKNPTNYITNPQLTKQDPARNNNKNENNMTPKNQNQNTPTFCAAWWRPILRTTSNESSCDTVTTATSCTTSTSAADYCETDDLESVDGSSLSSVATSTTMAIPIHQACKDGNLQQVLDLVASNNPKILLLLDDSASNYYCGSTPLELATQNGHLELVQYILYLFPNELVKKNHQGHTLLHLAIQHGQEKMVQFLVQYCFFSPNNCTYLGFDIQEILEFANQCNQVEIIEFLQFLVKHQPEILQLLITTQHRVNIDREIDRLQDVIDMEPITVTEWVVWNDATKKLKLLNWLCIFDCYQSVSELQERIFKLKSEMIKLEWNFRLPLLHAKDRYEKQLQNEIHEMERLRRESNINNNDRDDDDCCMDSNYRGNESNKNNNNNNNPRRCDEAIDDFLPPPPPIRRSALTIPPS